MTAIGIHDEGVAGVVLSGHWDDEWPSVTKDLCHKMMAPYIGAERAMWPGADRQRKFPILKFSSSAGITPAPRRVKQHHLPFMPAPPAAVSDPSSLHFEAATRH